MSLAVRISRAAAPFRRFVSLPFYAEVVQAVPCRSQLMHPSHLFPARLSFCSWRINDGVLKRDHVWPSLEMV
jgi:hypothetical protein